MSFFPVWCVVDLKKSTLISSHQTFEEAKVFYNQIFSELSSYFSIHLSNGVVIRPTDIDNIGIVFYRAIGKSPIIKNH